MTKISYISWGSYNKGRVMTKDFRYIIKISNLYLVRWTSSSIIVIKVSIISFKLYKTLIKFWGVIAKQEQIEIMLKVLLENLLIISYNKILQALFSWMISINLKIIFAKLFIIRYIISICTFLVFSSSFLMNLEILINYFKLESYGCFIF